MDTIFSYYFFKNKFRRSKKYKELTLSRDFRNSPGKLNRNTGLDSTSRDLQLRPKSRINIGIWFRVCLQITLIPQNTKSLSSTLLTYPYQNMVAAFQHLIQRDLRIKILITKKVYTTSIIFTKVQNLF
jgi:hypothetical protein